MENLIEREFTLTEILIKTTYQIAISDDPSFERNPIAFGAGFLIRYKEHLFFVTADHNIRIADHRINEITGIENYVGIFNNISNKENFSTMITPVGNFHHMAKFDMSKKELEIQLIDVAISLIKNNFESQFFTNEEIYSNDGTRVATPNEPKLQFLEEHIAEPSKEDSYYIFGHIRPKIKGLFLHKESTFKNDLKYIDAYGEYILLNTEYKITDYEDWAGLSGSPVLNQEGKCIGVLCSVNEGTNMVFVKPFKKIVPFFNTVISLEKLENRNNGKSI